MIFESYLDGLEQSLLRENKNINLCKILKGHEGEIFYSPFYGDIKVDYIENTSIGFSSVISKNDMFCVNCNGFVVFNDTIIGPECIVFPSKDQRDWNKWIEENKKTPKTWIEYINSEYYIWNEVIGHLATKEEPVYKSMFASLKLHQLIEVGYGGNVTNKEWYNDLIPKFIIIEKAKGVFTDYCVRKQNHRTPIAFHKSSQSQEFLSYPKNIQLLKDYFGIN